MIVLLGIAGLVILFGGAIVVNAGGQRKTATNTTSQPSAALTVSSAKAREEQWPESVKASGAIAPWQEAVIGAEINGQRLVAVNVNVGDKVKKGQVLARFNTDTLQAEQAELNANWMKAESDRKRAVELKDSGALSSQEIESFENLAAVAKARLDSKNMQLRYAEVIAPDEGVISSRTATIGSVGNAGAELFRMILKNRLEWRGELTASQLVQMDTKQVVTLNLPDGTVAHAIVRQTSPSLNSNSRMALVYADIEQANDSHAMAGMYADGLIVLRQSTATIIPAQSVVIRDGHSYVFKLQQPGAAITGVRMVSVTTGRHIGSNIEITSGIKVEDEVAVEGAGFLNDGDHVRISNQSGK
ncbi:MAG: efflux RND transporter periplasmic adaptor subunit [Alphaproteobacteria bacterium]|nr:efflux RND transporter periplasmic adaptor subunit [Alphaproteobacteria bacterium]